MGGCEDAGRAIEEDVWQRSGTRRCGRACSYSSWSLPRSGAWFKLFREVPQAPFDSVDERFKYGSVGGEAAGLPLYIWETLPEMFAEHMPRAGGYEVFGYLLRGGPVGATGFSVKTIGVPKVSQRSGRASGSTRRCRATATADTSGEPTCRGRQGRAAGVCENALTPGAHLGERRVSRVLPAVSSRSWPVTTRRAPRDRPPRRAGRRSRCAACW